MLLLEALTVCSVTNLKGWEKKKHSVNQSENFMRTSIFCIFAITVGTVGHESVVLTCLQKFQDYEVTHFTH